jgi:hypothetical protein
MHLLAGIAVLFLVRQLDSREVVVQRGSAHPEPLRIRLAGE